MKTVIKVVAVVAILVGASGYDIHLENVQQEKEVKHLAYLYQQPVGNVKLIVNSIPCALQMHIESEGNLYIVTETNSRPVVKDWVCVVDGKYIQQQ